MAPGDSERPDRPDYNVYRAGSGGRRSGRRDEPKQSGSGGRGETSGAKGASKASAGKDGDPGYSVYKSQRRFGRGEGGDRPSLRERLGRGGDRPSRAPGEKPLWRKVGKWALIGAGAWILLSVVLFIVSAQLQSSKLDGEAAELLGGSPLMLASPQTILVIGTDARPEGTNEEGAETDPECLEAAATGATAPASCIPSRADTLMLVRAGGGKFEKLSIPRDTLAPIPGQEPQKINAAYAFGGAALQIETVEALLGIDVDHVVILDFAGFADFIDAIGGVTVALPAPVKSLINGGSTNGGVTLKLERGENHLNGDEALALARTRENLKDPTEDDTDRARRQQLILAGIKNQLTSPWNAPENFLRGPLIAWNAPKAMVSDMGGFMLPQLALSAAIGGDSGTSILKPSGLTAEGSLVVSQRECRKQVRKFLGEAGPEEPQCSEDEAIAP